MAQVELARIYYYGDAVPQDLQKAGEWLEKAITAKNPTAMVEMGRLCSQTGDNLQAMKCFFYAVRSGDGDVLALLSEVCDQQEIAEEFLQLAQNPVSPPKQGTETILTPVPMIDQIRYRKLTQRFLFLMALNRQRAGSPCKLARIIERFLLHKERIGSKRKRKEIGREGNGEKI